MVKKNKNSFSLSSNEIVNVQDDNDSINIESFLYEGDKKTPDRNKENQSDVIGILPIRNVVVFPGTVTPLAIGRKESRELVEDISQNGSVIGLIVQKKPDLDTPTFEDLYSVGTTVSVLKVIRLPQGPMHIVVHGISRFKVLEIVSTKPYLKAKVQYLNTSIKMTKRLKALIVNVRQAANRVPRSTP